MIYGANNVHVVRDLTDLIGIRTLLLRQYWQPEGVISNQADLDGQKPSAPSASKGVLLMGEQTLKERGRFATIWTYQGINGDGKSVTFKDRRNSIDYGFEPGFALVPIQVHREFDKMQATFQGFPSNDGTSVIWPPELSAGGGGGSGLSVGRRTASQLNPMFGIQSYFEMDGVYRFRYAELKLPPKLFDGVGFISDDLPGEPPSVKQLGGEDRDWMKAPPTYDRKGIVYDITEYYWLSRRGGWPKPVYERGYFG